MTPLLSVLVCPRLMPLIFSFCFYTRTRAFDYPSASDSLSETTILDTNVYNVQFTLDTSKATCPNEIPPIVLSTCASALCKPLHYLFCLCLDSGYLPADRKVHKIIPVFKCGDCSLIINYCPISLLSNISNVLESLIYDKIIHHVIPLSNLFNLDLCQTGLLLNSF